MSQGNDEIQLSTATGANWYHGPYLLLTIALFLTVILYPLFERFLGPHVQNALFTLLLLSGLRAISAHRWLFRILGAIVLPVLVLNWITDNVASHEILDWLTAVVTQLFMAMVMVAVFWDVIRSRRVTVDVIFGSVAVYLLFGVVMAMALQLANAIDPGSVIAAVTAENTQQGRHFDEFLYFSFITLTSVGFGDLAPLGPIARSLAVFEGVVGQLYMAILIARIVGIHVAQE